MDFGHKTFWHHLHKQRDELESILIDVERRAFELFLVSKNAMWVLDHQRSSSDTTLEECGVYDDEPILKPKKTVSSQTLDLEDIEDPLDVAIREKRDGLWEKIGTRLARYCAPARSQYYHERIQVICACFARAVHADPILMMLAQNYPHVMSIMKDASLDLPTVEKLWMAIKNLYVDDVRAAIDDVLHPVRLTGEYVVVCGIRLHKEPSGVSLPFHGWGHMTAVFPCYSCVRRVCKSVDDIVALTKYAHLSKAGLAQSHTKYDFDIEGSRTLALCGFVPNSIDSGGPRYYIEKDNRRTKGNKPLWRESKTNHVICAGLSLTDPKTQVFVNACLRHPNFMVLCRKGADGRPIRSKPLCGTEYRMADTRAGLKNAKWDPTSAVLFVDTVLEEARPLIFADKHLGDCFQIVIVNGGEGEVEDFVERLNQVWYQVYEVDNFTELVALIVQPYADDKELEVDDDEASDAVHIVPNVEPDVSKSYSELWNRAPRSGRLVDDEMGVEAITNY
ncbi:hypothetical protein GALMADRAFT_433037 [Galerina marginata CBS 339.88]|uniref:Uncharacterized protein n=1 Tax=Galerina marginata (strain CBS 339.88) TaxID=685588 RepID=A0A067T1T5_GALM3|nr:hypothetical protein GALMADRAFT_433037 [Galerina marginata CBS 339.88]